MYHDEQLYDCFDLTVSRRDGAVAFEVGHQLFETVYTASSEQNEKKREAGTRKFQEKNPSP